MNKTQVFTVLGLIFGLALAGLAYLGLTGQLISFSPASVEDIEERSGEDFGPVTLQLSGQDFLDDQAARKLLWRLHELGLPSQAQVTRVDQDGAWSSIFLGPFASQAQLEQARQHYEKNIGPLSQSSGLGTVMIDRPGESARPHILLEMAATVADEDVFELLEGPDQAKVYAFVRTAEVLDLPDGAQALNRIYLGPFATESEALAAMGRLRNWGPGNDFTMKTLLPPGL